MTHTSTGWDSPEEFIVKAADEETDLYGVMYKPYDFDPGKKYPVIEYIYGGPQTTNVPRDFGQNIFSEFQAFPRALAQLGYVVVILDARGTPERSKTFQDVIYGNWWRNEIPDHAGAIKQLGAEKSYIDLDKVGIFGHSWGGYF
ncbi:MAG: prolyl oligopeptidase family serine peptidase, partial [Candidatus Aminicenantes bacterium]|nr:prolyl oligopeptidase family serine peptidase [Candidatus Aminicenantes bacterium]